MHCSFLLQLCLRGKKEAGILGTERQGSGGKELFRRRPQRFGFYNTLRNDTTGQRALSLCRWHENTWLPTTFISLSSTSKSVLYTYAMMASIPFLTTS